MDTQVKDTTQTTKKISKGIMIFVLPYLLNMLVQNLYGAVDLFVVGHFGSSADASGVTIGSQVMSMLTQLIIGFATAVTVLVGRHFGAKKERELSKDFGSSSFLFAVMAVISFCLLFFLRKVIVRVMNTPDEAVAVTGEYLLICAFGLFFIAGFNVVSSVMMGMGNTKTPFFFICIACVINIGLDFLLVAGFSMGAKGAAIATVAAQAGSLLIAVIYILVKGFPFKVHKADFKPDGATLRQLLVIGVPTAVQNVLVGASFLFITATINKIGLTASAAVGVVEKLISFMMMPSMSFSAAVSALGAQAFGAGDKKGANKILLLCIAFSLVPAVIITALTFFVPSVFTRIFSSNPEIVSLAAQYLKSYGFDILLVAFLFPANGYFAVINCSWFTLLYNLASTFGLRIPLTVVFSGLKNTSLFVIGWAAPISTAASLALIAVFFVVLYAHQRRPEKTAKNEKIAALRK